MIKGSIQEDITILRIYAPNTGAPTYIKQILPDVNRKIDSNTIKVGNFKTPLITMDKSSRQKINKETLTLKDTLEQIDGCIYDTFHPKASEYTSFSSAHGTFSRIDHMLCFKTTLSKFKEIEIMSSIFSKHNAMRLQIDFKKITAKNTNTWRLNNTLLNNQWITEEIREEIKNT